jgi:3-oxoadipate enol-lactonase
MPYFERSAAPRLYYEFDDYTDPWKNAPCIMLQHGYARSTKFWRAWIPYLSRFYRVLRLDLRGLGESGRDFDLERGINLDAYLKDFTDLLDGIDPRTIARSSAGISMALPPSATGACVRRHFSPVAMSEETR